MPRRRCPQVLLAALALVLTVAAPLAAVTYPDRPHDLLLELPPPPTPKWAVVGAPPAAEPVMSTGSALRMSRAPACVLMDGFLNMDKGPMDGMEVVACTRDGKCHEALVRVDMSGRDCGFIKFACRAALGLDYDGVPASQDSGVPARGFPVRLRIYWQDVDEADWKVIDASCLIRDRDMDKAYPPLPFIYTGSRTVSQVEIGADGQPERRERFMLNNTRSIAVAYDEADALIQSPFPGARENARFEANSALTPPVGAKLVLAIENAVLPLELACDVKGALSEKGVALDDARITARLAAVYGQLGADSLRAVGIQISRATDDRVAVELRRHLLELAAAAKVWVVPVFVLPGG